MIWHGRVFGIQSLWRHIKQAKALAGDPGDDFRRYAAPGPCFADAEQTPGTRNAGNDGVGVQWFHRTQIHDLNFPAFAGKFRRCFE